MNFNTMTSSPPRWQWGSLAAIVLSIVVVVVAQAIDGGTVLSLLRGPAALIVFGGTFAATLVSYSPKVVAGAIRAAVRSFKDPDDDLDELSAELVALSVRAHRRGLLALEADLDRMNDPFLRRGLAMAIDGVSSEVLRDALNVERLAHESREDVPVRVFEAAAGYAPTLGILGAVLGLIRVMESLASPAALGSGIAMAFVATAYGVGSANLVFLPVAARLRERMVAATRRRNLVTEALLDVQKRINPRVVAEKTRLFTNELPRVDEIMKRVSPFVAETPRLPA